jgi:hypothetical protein
MTVDRATLYSQRASNYLQCTSNLPQHVQFDARQRRQRHRPASTNNENPVSQTNEQEVLP